MTLLMLLTAQPDFSSPIILKQKTEPFRTPCINRPPNMHMQQHFRAIRKLKEAIRAQYSPVQEPKWKTIDWSKEGQTFYETIEKAIEHQRDGEQAVPFQVLNSYQTIYLNLPEGLYDSSDRFSDFRTYKELMDEFLNQSCPNVFEIFQKLNLLQHKCKSAKDAFLCVLDKEKQKALPLDFVVTRDHYRKDIDNPFLANLAKICLANDNFLSLEKYMARLLLHYYSHALIGRDFVTLSSTGKIFEQGLRTVQLIYKFLERNKPDFTFFIEYGPGNGNHMLEIFTYLTSDANIWDPERIREIKENVIFCMNDMGEGPAKIMQRLNTERFEKAGFKILHNVSPKEIKKRIQEKKALGKKVGTIISKHEFEDAIAHAAYQKTQDGWKELGIGTCVEKKGEFELKFNSIDFNPTDEQVPVGSCFYHSPEGRQFMECTLDIMQISDVGVQFTDDYFWTQGVIDKFYTLKDHIFRHYFSSNYGPDRKRLGIYDMADITVSPNINEFESVAIASGMRTLRIKTHTLHKRLIGYVNERLDRFFTIIIDHNNSGMIEAIQSMEGGQYSLTRDLKLIYRSHGEKPPSKSWSGRLEKGEIYAILKDKLTQMSGPALIWPSDLVFWQKLNELLNPSDRSPWRRDDPRYEKLYIEIDLGLLTPDVIQQLKSLDNFVFFAKGEDGYPLKDYISWYSLESAFKLYGSLENMTKESAEDMFRKLHESLSSGRKLFFGYEVDWLVKLNERLMAIGLPADYQLDIPALTVDISLLSPEKKAELDLIKKRFSLKYPDSTNPETLEFFRLGEDGYPIKDVIKPLIHEWDAVFNLYGGIERMTKESAEDMFKKLYELNPNPCYYIYQKQVDLLVKLNEVLIASGLPTDYKLNIPQIAIKPVLFDEQKRIQLDSIRSRFSLIQYRDRGNESFIKDSLWVQKGMANQLCVTIFRPQMDRYEFARHYDDTQLLPFSSTRGFNSSVENSDLGSLIGNLIYSLFARLYPKLPKAICSPTALLEEDSHESPFLPISITREVEKSEEAGPASP